MKPCLLAVSLLTVQGGPAFARDEKAEAVAKQKTAAEANLAKAGLAKMTHAETDDLLVYSPLPESKNKTLAELAQKTFQLARTTLKFESGEKLWPGKLTLIALSDPAPFGNFIRLVEMRRPDKGVSYSIAIRGDEPYAIDSVEPGEKHSDAEFAADAAALVGGALLKKKAGSGAELPEWLMFGFGRATVVRADGSTSRLSGHRAKARTAVLGTKTRPSLVRLADIWSGQKTKDSDLVAASFVEFLAFGPPAEKFPAFVSAFRVSDERPMPTVQTALADLEWKPDALELEWKQWVLKAK
jgi:hypothetical protein